jgi:hypothetical protein
MKEDVLHEAAPPGLTKGSASVNLFPDDLLAGTRESDWAGGERHHWWLVYTKSRQEKALAQQLLARDVFFYLPLIKRTSLSRGRTRTADVPLFPGYLFLYGTAAERIQRQDRSVRGQWAHPIQVRQSNRVSRAENTTCGAGFECLAHSSHSRICCYLCVSRLRL